MSASITCPSCGRPNLSGTSFCAYCGARIAPAASVASAAPPAPTMPAAYPYAAPAPYYAPPPRAHATGMIAGTFRVWAENIGSFFLVYLLVSLLTGGLSLLGSWILLGKPLVSSSPLFVAAPAAASLAAFVGYEILVAILAWIISSVVLGGVVEFSIRRHRGEPARIGESLMRGLQRVASIMGANLLVTLIILGAVILWAVAIILGAVTLFTVGATAAGITFILVALVVGVVVVLYLVLGLALYAPAIMGEGAHAVHSLGRSWALMRGHKLSLFGSGLLFGFLGLVIGGLIGVVGAIVGNPYVSLIASAIASAITGAWLTILAAVAYDLIVRTPQPSAWPPTYAPVPPPVR